MNSPDELFDIVDDNDVVIGQAPRSQCHGNPELVHRVIHVLVFNRAGKLLLQKRSLGKDIQPGKWDASVGGHLDCGESYLAAANREMKEELGLSGLPLTFLYNSTIRNEIESENVRTYLAITDQRVTFNHDEISEVRFWGHDEIEQALQSGLFTPNFEDEWHMLQDYARRYHSEKTEGAGLCPGDSFPNLWLELSAGHCAGV